MKYFFAILTIYLPFICSGNISPTKSIYLAPFITNFPKNHYNAGYENWDIVQDNQGVVYFANNNGLLQFNNKSWRCHPLPNKTVVRSLAIDENDVIYVGGQNEFGYFAPNERGERIFTSLKELIPEENRNFEDVWKIFITPKSGIYFLTSDKLFWYHNNQITTYFPVGLFNNIGVLDGNIVVQDTKAGLNILKPDGLEQLEGTIFFNASPITEILSLNNGKYLITTISWGVYLFDGKSFTEWGNNIQDLFREERIQSTALLKNGNVVVGTIFNGLYILGENGTILQHINVRNGLSNNEILSILVDKEQNLWLGLENGIDYLKSNSYASRFSTFDKIEGAGYDVEIVGNTIFFGTSKGIFYSVDKPKDPHNPNVYEIKEFTELKGQVWGFNVIDNDLLMGHHGGGFIIDNYNIKKISKLWGVWLFQRLQSNPDFIISGNYTGLSLYKKEKGDFQFIRDIPGFNESARFVEQDGYGNIWVAHPYKGIYKLILNENMDSLFVEKYGERNGLSSDLGNYLFKVYNEIVFCSEHRVYSYLEEKDSFVINQTYDSIFGSDNNVRFLRQAQSGSIWYIDKDGVGVLEVSERGLSPKISNKRFSGLNHLLVNGFEMIYPLNDSNIYIGSESGFIHLNPQKNIEENIIHKVILDNISLTTGNKEILFKGIRGSDTNPDKIIDCNFELTSKMNSLLFSFVSTDYCNSNSLQYRYYLEGLEDESFDWTEKSEKEYTNLRHGEYVFHVQSKSNTGLITPITSYRFEILPPWYLTRIAWTVYILIVTSMLIWLVLFLRGKYMVQKEKVKLTERKVKQLKEESLQKEISFKNRELITASVHISHKNEILTKIDKAIQKIVDSARDYGLSKQLRQVTKMIRDEEGIDKEISQFSKLFNEVHPGFLDRLNSKYPSLSSKDLKMCSYIRMNMSTKEIASISNMTIRGVEGSRYRLRKKLRLSKETDLASFILHF